MHITTTNCDKTTLIKPVPLCEERAKKINNWYLLTRWQQFSFHISRFTLHTIISRATIPSISPTRSTAKQSRSVSAVSTTSSASRMCPIVYVQVFVVILVLVSIMQSGAFLCITKSHFRIKKIQIRSSAFRKNKTKRCRHWFKFSAFIYFLHLIIITLSSSMTWSTSVYRGRYSPYHCTMPSIKLAKLNITASNPIEMRWFIFCFQLDEIKLDDTSQR